MMNNTPSGAYKLAVFEILRDLYVLVYIAHRAIPTYRVYRLYEYLCLMFSSNPAQLFNACSMHKWSVMF